MGSKAWQGENRIEDMMGTLSRVIVWVIAAAAVGVGGLYGYWHLTAAPERSYRTAPVKRGDIVSTINATGTVEPEETVDIGAQVAGQINTFGKDKDGKQIDYGSVVDANTMLAEIDASLYESDLAQAKAQLEVDRAGVIKSQADLEQLKAKLEQAQADQEQAKGKLVQVTADTEQSKGRVDQAESDLEQFKGKLAEAQGNLEQAKAKYEQAQRDWDRAQKIGPSDALSQEAYDTYKGTYETTRASITSAQAVVAQSQSNIISQKSVIAQAQSNLASGKAMISQAQSSIVSLNAVISQAKANVASGDATIKQAQSTVVHDDAVVLRAQQNLGYCTIKSPVKGVIIDRRVNIGQTVVSSLNTPSLFLLAKDLNKMQVWVSVNEADIGHIHPGQPVTFTTDAFGAQIFQGAVRKIRLNATMTQNVVTFTVEVETDNSSGKLLPYLTANANFEVAKKSDALMVPNAALRFIPQPSEVAPDVVIEEGPRHGGGGGGGAGAGTDAAAAGIRDLGQAGASGWRKERQCGWREKGTAQEIRNGTRQAVDQGRQFLAADSRADGHQRRNEHGSGEHRVDGRHGRGRRKAGGIGCACRRGQSVYAAVGAASEYECAEMRDCHISDIVVRASSLQPGECRLEARTTI